MHPWSQISSGISVPEDAQVRVDAGDQRIHRRRRLCALQESEHSQVSQIAYCQLSLSAIGSLVNW